MQFVLSESEHFNNTNRLNMGKYHLFEVLAFQDVGLPLNPIGHGCFDQQLVMGSKSYVGCT